MSVIECNELGDFVFLIRKLGGEEGKKDYFFKVKFGKFDEIAGTNL